MAPKKPDPPEQAEIARLADEFARAATRDILKPDHGLPVLESLAHKPARRPAESGSSDKPTIEDLWHRLADMDQRIARQQRRIDKVTINREGPVDELRALFDHMVKARG